MKPPKLIELKPEDVEALLSRVEKGFLQEGDYEIIKGIVEALAYLSQAVDEKATAIKRLLRMIFGAKTKDQGEALKDRKQPERGRRPGRETGTAEAAGSWQKRRGRLQKSGADQSAYRGHEGR